MNGAAPPDRRTCSSGHVTFTSTRIDDYQFHLSRVITPHQELSGTLLSAEHCGHAGFYMNTWTLGQRNKRAWFSGHLVLLFRSAPDRTAPRISGARARAVGVRKMDGMC